MVAYQQKLDELKQLGVTVIGVTAEGRETAVRMAEEDGLTFPIAYGVGEEAIAPLAPMWTHSDRLGTFFQPMEFIVREGTVIASMYASGPIGRMDVAHAASYIRMHEDR